MPFNNGRNSNKVKLEVPSVAMGAYKNMLKREINYGAKSFGEGRGEGKGSDRDWNIKAIFK